jgi:hypothetical protein
MTEDVKENTILPSLKIAILGTASSSLSDAPFKDETWKIWSLGFNASVIPRGDKWFEIHDEAVLTEVGICPTAVERMRKAKTDLFAHNCGAMFPEASKFPFEMILKEFPRKYFTSSIAWMLGLAIITQLELQKSTGGEFGEIGIWGIDMCDTDEYAFQKGACEYLIGYADAKGIKVTVAKDSPICRIGRMYAYEDVGISRELVIRRRSLKNEMDRREKSYLEERDLHHFFKGRLHECNDISNRWR